MTTKMVSYFSQTISLLSLLLQFPAIISVYASSVVVKHFYYLSVTLISNIFTSNFIIYLLITNIIEYNLLLITNKIINFEYNLHDQLIK